MPTLEGKVLYNINAYNANKRSSSIQIFWDKNKNTDYCYIKYPEIDCRQIFVLRLKNIDFGDVMNVKVKINNSFLEDSLVRRKDTVHVECELKQIFTTASNETNDTIELQFESGKLNNPDAVYLPSDDFFKQIARACGPEQSSEKVYFIKDHSTKDKNVKIEIIQRKAEF